MTRFETEPRGDCAPRQAWGAFPFIGRFDRAWWTLIVAGAAAAWWLGLGLAPPARAAEIRAVTSLLELRQDRVVVQQWDLSCGAAALATLLRYQHGDPVSEKEVAKGLVKREEYLKNPDLLQAQLGFSLLDLKRYVDERGYRGLGYGNLALEDLVRWAPIVVPIDHQGYNHFVIFRGVLGNRVLLADPAWGNRTMLIDQFEDAWLDHPELGKVGFVVARRDGAPPPNRLAPRPSDFLMLR